MEIRKIKLGSKNTVSLRITEKEYSRIDHLFDETGRPTSKKLEYNYGGYRWTLYRGKPIIESGGKHLGYNIYGTCGDSTFGNIPWFYNLRYAGNIRAGREIYSKFIEKYGR